MNREDSAWIPACGGTELPFTCEGETFEYMWNYVTKKHSYYSHTRDMFLSQNELPFALGGVRLPEINYGRII